MSKKRILFVLPPLLLLTCTAEDNRLRLAHTADQPSIIDNRAHAAFGEQGREISLVTWRFSEGSGNLEGLGVVDLDTGLPIPNQPAVVDGELVITLILPTGVPSKPHIVLGNGNSNLGYTAEVTPIYGISAFQRHFSPQTDFVLDLGIEKLLEEGAEMEFSPGELSRQWIEDKFQLVARARFTNEGPSGSFVVSVPPQSHGWLKKAKQTTISQNSAIKLENGESASFAITGSETLSIRLTRE